MDNLSILLLKQHGLWAAQCLQYDVAAQGETIESAVLNLQRALASEIVVCEALGKDCKTDLPAAPEYYWNVYRDMADKVEAKSLPPLRTPADVPPAFMLKQPELRVA